MLCYSCKPFTSEGVPGRESTFLGRNPSSRGLETLLPPLRASLLFCAALAAREMESVVTRRGGGGCLSLVGGPWKTSPWAVNTWLSVPKLNPRPAPVGVMGRGLIKGLRLGERGAMMPSAVFRLLRNRRTASRSKRGSKSVLNKLCLGKTGSRGDF